MFYRMVKRKTKKEKGDNVIVQTSNLTIKFVNKNAHSWLLKRRITEALNWFESHGYEVYGYTTKENLEKDIDGFLVGN